MPEAGGRNLEPLLHSAGGADLLLPPSLTDRWYFCRALDDLMEVPGVSGVKQTLIEDFCAGTQMAGRQRNTGGREI